MEQVIKTEIQSNGEILLFYMDENGENEEGVITTIENIEQGQLHPFSENYVIEEVNDSSEEADVAQEDVTGNQRWLDDEIKRLLIFYIDNKETFINGRTKKRHIWTVACKTILTNWNPESCDMKLRNLKKRYAMIHTALLKNNSYDPSKWRFYDLCHQAFHDDSYVKMIIAGQGFVEQESGEGANLLLEQNEDGMMLANKINLHRTSPDEKVTLMLKLYLQFKKNLPKEYWQRNIWAKIAAELGDDADYWHKRFLNFKQHYIRILDKRKESATEVIHWPYISLFDEIFEDDEHFHRKYGEPTRKYVEAKENPDTNIPVDWNDTEKTVLVKYYFDCFDEFRDATIPKGFLWNEVGRLLDRTPESCLTKYEELKSQHMDRIIEGGYDLRTRKPIEILFDNIISKEIELELSNSENIPNGLDVWKVELLDELVQFVYDNLGMFKDNICHFVCWAIISKKLCQSIHHCRHQWRDLSMLYKSLLNDKKEHPDMQIDWRYIDLFDRIFDYGMDMKLLDGYEIYQKNSKSTKSAKMVVKDDVPGHETEENNERSISKRSIGTGDPKQFRILEYYQKHKDTFATTTHKKTALWEELADKIGISAEQCAHRFRNLKQVYNAYIQRELNKPEMPIVWPYYALCKKVFGYRAIKNKIRRAKGSVEMEWCPSEIRALVTYFGQNFHAISWNTDDKSLWYDLSRQINKTQTSCREKFIDLRKAYRKLTTLRSRNPDCNINWPYFKMFDEIYTQAGLGSKNKVTGEKVNAPLELPTDKSEAMDEDEDFQCIIVLPEGQEITDLSNAQIIVKDNTETHPPEPNTPETHKPKKKPAWSKRNRILLLKYYYDYVKSREGKVINSTLMWKEIASKFPKKSLISCRRLYLGLKRYYKKQKDNENERAKNPEIWELMDKIFALKPKFVRLPLKLEDIVLAEKKKYKDVPLALWKIETALKYYLEHMDEFVNPKYDKKYAWIDLAKLIDVNVMKIFRKLNYLKQHYNSETNEVNGEKFEFGDMLKEILEKEFLLKVLLSNEQKPMAVDEEPVSWSDEEIQELLTWYLQNLDKFKSPKYIRSYLWMEASEVLKKSPLVCTKKMSEIRTLYSNMVKEMPEELKNWRFYELCLKIYGTGKKTTPVSSD